MCYCAIEKKFRKLWYVWAQCSAHPLPDSFLCLFESSNNIWFVISFEFVTKSAAVFVSIIKTKEYQIIGFK